MEFLGFIVGLILVYGLYRIIRRIFYTFEDIYYDFNARFPRKDKEEEDEN